MPRSSTAERPVCWIKREKASHKGPLWWGGGVHRERGLGPAPGGAEGLKCPSQQFLGMHKECEGQDARASDLTACTTVTLLWPNSGCQVGILRPRPLCALWVCAVLRTPASHQGGKRGPRLRIIRPSIQPDKAPSTMAWHVESSMVVILKYKRSRDQVLEPPISPCFFPISIRAGLPEPTSSLSVKNLVP